MILLTCLGARIRVAEACALQVQDFTDSACRKFKVRIQKKKDNVIVEKELPESIAALLRGWIQDNRGFIQEAQGYVFPHRSNNRYWHTQPKHVQDFMIKKRNYLGKIYPERSFKSAIGTAVYKNVDGSPIPKSKVENRYMWSSHLMKRLSGTLIQLIEKNPKFTQAMLSHDNIKVTMTHYCDEAALLERKEGKIMNRIFDQQFYDEILGDNEIAPAVWHNIKQ